MAIKINFSERYSDLISNDIPKHTLTSMEDRGGYLVGGNKPTIPEKYQKNFVHTPNGFAANFCEEY